MTRAETIRANVRAILAAATHRGPGWRTWSPIYPDTHNPVKAAAGRDPFGVRAPGAFTFWWSDVRTRPHGSVEEVRRGLWAPIRRQLLKAEARNLIQQAARIREDA